MLWKNISHCYRHLKKIFDIILKFKKKYKYFKINQIEIFKDIYLKTSGWTPDNINL